MEFSEEERQRLAQDGATSIEVRPTQESWIRKRWAWLMFLGLAIVILAVVVAIMKRPRSGASVGRDRSTSHIASDHSPGSEVMLFVQGRESVMVAVDEKALDELIAAVSTRGDEAQNLIQSGRVLTVPNKTRARIIEAAFSKLKVRIIEGDKIMFEVWVPEPWVK